MDISLDENDYDYHGMLDLFSLPDDFNEYDLKKAKRKVLLLHPDKSGLDKKYFMFFMKMHKKIQQVYNFTHHETDVHKLKRDIDIDDHFKRYLESKNINPKNNFKQFTVEFNKMFEETFIKEDENGYADWLKSDDAMYDKDDIEKSRRSAIRNQALVIRQDEIEEVGGGLCEHNSRLNCFDVRESHSTPVLAIDVERVYAEKPKFKSVNEYQQFLAAEDRSNAPLGLEQSNLLLRKREQMLNNQAKNLAYNAMVHSESMKKKYNNYISSQLQLKWWMISWTYLLK